MANGALDGEEVGFQVSFLLTSPFLASKDILTCQLRVLMASQHAIQAFITRLWEGEKSGSSVISIRSIMRQLMRQKLTEEDRRIQFDAIMAFQHAN